LPERLFRRPEPHLRRLLQRREALGEPEQNNETDDGKNWGHGDLIFLVIVLIEIILLKIRVVVARAIAVIVAPVAISANRTGDHDSIFWRRTNCFLSYVCITFGGKIEMGQIYL
jgi:hypothetical protein